MTETEARNLKKGDIVHSTSAITGKPITGTVVANGQHNVKIQWPDRVLTHDHDMMKPASLQPPPL
jgi:hypothetical protein